MKNTYLTLTCIGITTALLTACGGSSGGGGAGPLTEQRAALIAKFGGGFADTALDLADPDDDNVAPFSFTKSATPGTAYERRLAMVRKSAEVQQKQGSEACDSGSIQEEGPVSRDVGSPYAGTLQVSRTVANDCRVSFSEGDFSFSSRTDGIIENGEGDSDRVFYFRATDISDSLSNGFLIQETRGDFGNFSSRLRGIFNVCESCSSPVDGGMMEYQAFLRAEFDFGDGAFTILQGNSAQDPLLFTGKQASANLVEVSINGRLGFSQQGKPECSFDGTYETISPLLVENFDSDNERTVGGEVDIQEGGNTFRVVFLSNGSVQVNGQVFTEEQLEALADEQCDLDDDFEG